MATGGTERGSREGLNKN